MTAHIHGMTHQTQTIDSDRTASPTKRLPKSRTSEPANDPGGTPTSEPVFMTAGRRLGYARVSTSSDGRQMHDRQTDALQAADIDQIFTDTLSGSKSSRPGLGALWALLREGDTVVILSLDRLGRDTRQLLAWVDELRAKGVHLQILQLGVDTATPAGAMVLTIIAALAEMEREVLRSRVGEGLAAARTRGRLGGRPASLSPAQIVEVRRPRTDGRPTGEVATLFRCSERTVRRAFAASVESEEVK